MDMNNDTPVDGGKQSPPDDPTGLSVWGSRTGWGVRGDTKGVIAVLIIAAVVILVVAFGVMAWADAAELSALFSSVRSVIPELVE